MWLTIQGKFLNIFFNYILWMKHVLWWKFSYIMDEKWTFMNELEKLCLIMMLNNDDLDDDIVTIFTNYHYIHYFHLNYPKWPTFDQRLCIYFQTHLLVSTAKMTQVLHFQNAHSMHNISFFLPFPHPQCVNQVQAFTSHPCRYIATPFILLWTFDTPWFIPLLASYIVFDPIIK